MHHGQQSIENLSMHSLKIIEISPQASEINIQIGKNTQRNLRHSIIIKPSNRMKIALAVQKKITGKMPRTYPERAL